MEQRNSSPEEARSRSQSMSTSGKTRDGEAPKMKGTCDRCALSKVKCDRQLPHCARCVSIGNELGIPPPCHYTVSLRSLRKSTGKKQGETSRKQSKARHTRSETASSVDGDDYSMNGRPQPPSPDARPNITSHPSFDASSFFEFDMKMDNTGEPDSYFPQQTPMSAFAPKGFPSNMADGMLFPDFGPRGSSCSTAPSTAAGDEYFSNSSSAFAEHSMSEPSRRRPSCADLVCLTVHELWRASRKSSCSMTAPTIPQALDEALMLNRTASDAVATVMNCSCARNPEFFFNAAFLLHSLMGFFRSIVDNALPHRQPGQQPLPPQDMQFLQAMSMGQSSGSSTPGLGAPMRLGVYTMDAEDEHRFKVQLLRSEVAKISKLIDDFVAKYCHWGQSEDLAQPPQSEMLKFCLSMELKQCLDELDARAGWV